VGNNPKKFEETMHRTISAVAIKDNLLFITDESGLVHCIDSKTGKAYWTHDMLASSWSTPLIVGDHVYIADLDGDITVFKLAKEKDQVSEQNMGTSVYTTPVVANGVLFIATFNTLYAISEGSNSKVTAGGAK
jgi:outer membrane protein assembly factor BamB